MSIVVPPKAPFSVSIAGHNYLADTSFEPYRREAFRHRSIQAQRANITVNNVPGEGTVDTQGYWRRIAQDWSLGSGQLYFDRRESVDNRFRQSKGVNIWSQWMMTLLEDTAKVYNASTGAADVTPLQCGDYLYVLDVGKTGPNTVSWATNPSLAGWTKAVNNIPTDFTGIATNGQQVWLASPSEGLYVSDVGVDAFVAMVTPPADDVWFAGDRLVFAHKNTVFNPLNAGTVVVGTLSGALTSGTTYGALPVNALVGSVTAGDYITLGLSNTVNQAFVASADAAIGATSISVIPEIANANYPNGTAFDQITPLWSHPNPDWIWGDMTYGSSEIYLSGYNGTLLVAFDHVGAGAVYKTTIDSNGINLIVPQVALPLEGGEYPTCLGSYLNLILVGTNLGLRVCETLSLYDPTGNAGDLKAGPLLPAAIEAVQEPVTGVCGNGRFIYFTWGNYDSTSSGIGRCDLSHFVDDLAPAYASDLMVTQLLGTGGKMTLDWCTIDTSPVMGITGSGLWVKSPNQVASGFLDSGLIGYGIPDDKIAMELSYVASGPMTYSAGMALDPYLTPNITDGAVDVVDSFTTVGTGAIGTGDTHRDTFMLDQLTAENFEIRTTLMASVLTGEYPTVSRWMLQSIPAVASGIEISVVIMLAPTVEDRGILEPVDIYGEYLYLELLRENQTPVVYVEGPMVFPVCTIDSLDWIPQSENNASPQRGFKGDCVVYLKVFTPPSPYIADLPTH